jgi:hypothetical protein
MFKSNSLVELSKQSLNMIMIYKSKIKIKLIKRENLIKKNTKIKLIILSFLIFPMNIEKTLD